MILPLQYLLFYVALPLYAVAHSMIKYASPIEDQFFEPWVIYCCWGVITVIVMLAGCAHFGVSLEKYSKLKLSHAMFARLITWDFPCWLWLYLGLEFERTMFQAFYRSPSTIFIGLLFTLPVSLFFSWSLNRILIAPEIDGIDWVQNTSTIGSDEK